MGYGLLFKALMWAFIAAFVQNQCRAYSPPTARLGRLAPHLSSLRRSLPSVSVPTALHQSSTAVGASASFITAAKVNGLGYLILRQVQQTSLTPAGLAHAAILGLGLWSTLGATGYAICVAYLILGSAVTKVKLAQKQREGIAEKRGGARGPENVWGSAATAMVCALLSLQNGHGTIFRVGYVAALCTKLADTFQSEIGKAYGKTTILVTTLRRVPRGTEGAVSLEGYAAGVLGSGLLAGLALELDVLSSLLEVAVCMVASVVGTTAESFIGAAFQTDKAAWLTNELVNVINTTIGAVVAMIGIMYLR